MLQEKINKLQQEVCIKILLDTISSSTVLWLLHPHTCAEYFQPVSVLCVGLSYHFTQTHSFACPYVNRVRYAT